LTKSPTKKKGTVMTLVGQRQARDNFAFIHQRSAAECQKCQLYSVCMKNLETDRLYKVVRVHDRSFPCPLHEDGVRLVEVEEPEIRAAMDHRHLFEGAVVAFTPMRCNKLSCRNFEACNPVGLKEGDKCRIERSLGSISCPAGEPLVLASLRRLRE
jgi:uncharacterized protein (UPF0179 family)